MRSTILLLASLLSTTFALPHQSHSTTRSNSPPSLGPWSITYNPGCGTSPAGCLYTFNISYSPSYGSQEPAFSTSCQGTNIQGSYKPCADASVSSNEYSNGLNDTLMVQHVYNVGEATYTVTGNVTITDFQTDGQKMVIVPNEITAVA